MKEYIRTAIQFFEYLFTRPTHWIVTAPLYKIIFVWLIFYMSIGFLMTAGGVFSLFRTDLFFKESFFYSLFVLAIGGILIFYGASLLHLAIYNVYYYIRIMISGEIVDGKITKVKFIRQRDGGKNSSPSSYNFSVEYQAPLNGTNLFDITHSTSINQSHMYSDLVIEGQSIKVKYWKKDPRKAHVLWNKSYK